MARAHRIGSAAALTAAVYFLVLFNVIPIPFLDPTTSSQILSVVRGSTIILNSCRLILTRSTQFVPSVRQNNYEPLLNRCYGLTLHIWLLPAPMVVPCVLRGLFIMDHRLGSSDTQRVSRGIRRTDKGNLKLIPSLYCLVHPCNSPGTYPPSWHTIYCGSGFSVGQSYIN